MTERIVKLRRDGAGVVAKHAGDSNEAAQLRREATLLEAARHPGVVELVALEEDGPASTLLTTDVGGSTLVEADALTVEEAGGVAAGVASTLADLHGLGVVHGAVAPEHVLIAPDGRPVLCGFGHGSRTGEVPPAPPVLPDGFHDPSRSPGDPLLPATDVFGLGALLRWLIQACEAPWDVGALGRAAPSAAKARLRPRGDAGRSILRLRALAARATAADPARRPTAAELAAAIPDAVPGSCLPTRGQAEAGPGPAVGVAGLGALDRLRTTRAAGRDRARRTLSGTHRRLRMVAVTAGTCLAVGIALAGARLAGSAARVPTSSTPEPAAGPSRPDEAGDRVVPAPSAAASEGADAVPSGAHSGPPPTSAGTGAASRCPAMTSLLAADVDGDGCPEALRYADGTLEAGTARWVVGQAGDQVAAGDWSCSGSSTLALLRPATGEVFVFAGWAPAGRDLAADRAGRVPGGFALRTADLDGDTCHELVVDRPDGPPVRVPVLAGSCPDPERTACGSGSP